MANESRERPIRVAIVGGGCAGVTAAYELTRPELEGRYEVTVYQLGWRLGGKGASGRGPADRIEEHGLHLWMGWYENAFRVMRECYEELGRDPATCPIATWTDAFKPDPFCGVMDLTPDGRWVPWTATYPLTEGMPGDPTGPDQKWTMRDYVVRALTLVRVTLEAVELKENPGDRDRVEWGADERGRPGWVKSPEAALQRLLRLVRAGELATLTTLIEAFGILEAAMRSLPIFSENLVLKILEAVSIASSEQLAMRVRTDDELRRLWEVVDITMAAVRGIFRFGLLTDPRGFDAIDEYDCREWLRLNGASDRSVDGAFLRAMYDLVFAYEDGDVNRPRIAAGQAMRCAVRAFLTYRGAIFWKMQAGMGDIVFAPFYEALKRRGVRFEFFHNLENVQVRGLASSAEGDRPYVHALEFDVQAALESGDEYHPLVDVHGLPSWPAEPDWKQLENGEQLQTAGVDFESFWNPTRSATKVLHVQEDFDFVVLAVGLGAIEHVCSEIVALDPRWQRMVDHVKTVPTQAAQVWLDSSMRDLGWDAPSINMCGFVEPFDTWADMTHLIPAESFPREPKSLAYFCSVLREPPTEQDHADPDYPARRHAEVKRNTVQFLNRDVGHMWPKAVRSGGFRWELLVDEKGRGGEGSCDESRIDTQFWTANVNPTDRYALSLPGTTRYRISPLDDAFDNLTVCGDWTSCGFNAGCVEAAVISGRLAAHAISLSPSLEEIVGFDHP